MKTKSLNVKCDSCVKLSNGVAIEQQILIGFGFVSISDRDTGEIISKPCGFVTGYTNSAITPVRIESIRLNKFENISIVDYEGMNCFLNKSGSDDNYKILSIKDISFDTLDDYLLETKATLCSDSGKVITVSFEDVILKGYKPNDFITKCNTFTCTLCDNVFKYKITCKSGQGVYLEVVCL